MQISNIPVQTYQVTCPRCKKYTTYSLFLSSFYDFQTYFGLTTKCLYRVDLDKVKYGISSEPNVVSEIFESEGGSENVLRLPEKVECNQCGNIFTPSSTDSCGFEEDVTAYVI